MADKATSLRKWSRSPATQKRLRYALLIMRFIDESMTIEQLLQLLSDMADELEISNWGQVCEIEEMRVLQSIPKDRKVWVQSEPLGLDVGNSGAVDAIWSLREVKDCAVGVLRHIRENVQNKRHAFHNGFGSGYSDERIRDLLPYIIPGKATVRRNEITRGKELRIDPALGNRYSAPAALPAFILDRFLSDKGWQYFQLCPGCEKHFISRRTKAITCSTKCRKRLERQRNQGLDKE